MKRPRVGERWRWRHESGGKVIAVTIEALWSSHYPEGLKDSVLCLLEASNTTQWLPKAGLLERI